MAIQIIICVESNKRARTDNIYIKETLERFYKLDKNININFINMGGKSKYDSKETRNEIKKLTKQYLIGETIVAYCFDTDYFEKNYEQDTELKKIQSYAKNMGAECIWFCHDIEEVYVGRSISKGEKKDTAIEYKKKGMITKIEKSKLESSYFVKGSSNILLVFDKYLIKK